ncbi:MAG: hypothetical protein LE169_04150 [Endomicrobium sp.]|nr:hypothetical protein [Endomicrobium sp.]
MKRLISAVLTLLLISGCVAPLRQLSKSDAVADVSDSVQPESLQKAPADICPEQQKSPVLQEKSTKGYWAAIIVLSVISVAAVYLGIRQYKQIQRLKNDYTAKTQDWFKPEQKQLYIRRIADLESDIEKLQSREAELLLELQNIATDKVVQSLTVENRTDMAPCEWALKYAIAKRSLNANDIAMQRLKAEIHRLSVLLEQK